MSLRMRACVRAWGAHTQVCNQNMYFLGVKSTAHPPIIGALGHSTHFIVKQPNTAMVNINLR